MAGNLLSRLRFHEYGTINAPPVDGPGGQDSPLRFRPPKTTRRAFYGRPAGYASADPGFSPPPGLTFFPL